MRKIYKFLCWIFLPIFFLVACLIALCSRVSSKNASERPRLVWGEAPIINNSYWARAMRSLGYYSVTFTDNYSYTINKREDYDFVIQELYGSVPVFLKYYVGFFVSLFKFDVYFISFNGYFLGKTPYWWLESYLLKIARKKIVVLPFGLDAFVYNRVKSVSMLHGLLMSISGPSRKQRSIAARVDYWCENADVVLLGFLSPDGFGRWDILMPNFLFIDYHEWPPSTRNSRSNGVDDIVYIAHAPNHRGFKGSEFVIDAVHQLQKEGLRVELVLIEGKQNFEVKRILKQDIDILVEQLIAVGHGLNGLEGMATGLPVISNLEDENYIVPLRRWSYFGECPIVSGSPENLVDILRKLVTRPELRQELGQAGRKYVEKYYGYDSAQYLFAEVIEYLYGRRERLIDLYHPLLSQYSNRLPKVIHPLKNGRLPE